MKKSICAAYVVACLYALSLTAADTTPPVVLSITPAPGSTVSNLAQVTVLFNEPVVSVFAWNLLVNGADADGVVSTGSSNFVFTFTQPLPGPVTISWEPTQNITDRSGNTFAGGPNWEYTLLDTIPPAV